MRRAAGLLAIVLALVSLLVPSLAIGARGVVSDPTPSYVLTAQGSYAKGQCLLKTGKSASCPRPDLGILPLAFSQADTVLSAGRPVPSETMGRDIAIEPALPPPRGR